MPSSEIKKNGNSFKPAASEDLCEFHVSQRRLEKRSSAKILEATFVAICLRTDNLKNIFFYKTMSTLC